ncbi:DUF3617 domain-containing protein [Novosphingobium sp. M1R2S20]|uniref:DUF3617 domain-containing protein n=1 Tax=Novosphingobium rhizovicinum TaxID=3228928 RepID=A0ABV3RAV6_9SPHN
MTYRRFMPSLVLAVGVLLVGSTAVLAQGRSSVLLDRFTPGEWELRSREGRGEPQRLCVRDARRFIQMRHAGQKCGQTVIEDGPDEITVQYTCPGNGYGRTHIRRETDDLWQIESQGIAQGRPFTFDAEVRRVGRCKA